MSRNREGLDPSARCYTTDGNYSFEWGCALDVKGRPIKMGYRICKNQDCIQPAHITQSRYIAKKVYGYLPDLKRRFKTIPVEISLLKKIAKPVDRDNPQNKCQVPDCHRPHRGLNLCNAHHGQLWRIRQAEGKTERIKRDNSDIEQYMIPPAGNDLKAKDRYCHYPECDRDYWARGLCKTHHRRWLRWKQSVGTR